ncbi:serine/threonine-protein kinase RsbW [Roseovarius halotolerans]|uniref:Serine/threonine-protein kinase BtrW n=1 Tax=Roseovarius halotolerans TaxID=505353 RepID=A0A1X6ZQL9_9RHOB|nr:ATP-binding protein [Roseovarius halotolerans]RKT27977.1 serine/threonine-protein kinase RsbW [Roseovarius halotolerans]SLN58746.1 Serine/threonine-protein kinase BtrW [Roseovarius halotolerans]
MVRSRPPTVVSPVSPPGSLSLQFDGCVADIRGALDSVRSHLAALGLGDERCGAVEIALAEALNNIAEHAFARRPPGPVYLDAEVEGTCLRINLVDLGCPLPGQTLPTGLHHDLDVAPDALPEGGFGWLLIRELTEEVSYIRSGAENRLTLVFSLE